MKKMSQKELLQEGFGSMLKTAASTVGKGALGAAKFVARDAAPVTSGLVSDVARALTPEEKLFAKNKASLDSKLKNDPDVDTFNITHHDKKSNTWAAEGADGKTKFFKQTGDNFEEVTLTPEEQTVIKSPGNATPDTEPDKGQTPKPGAKPASGQTPKPGAGSKPLINTPKQPKSPKSGDNQPAPNADTGPSITMQGSDQTQNTGGTTTIQADQQSQKEVIKNSRSEKLKPKKKKSSAGDNFRDGFDKIDFSKKD